MYGFKSDHGSSPENPNLNEDWSKKPVSVKQRRSMEGAAGSVKICIRVFKTY